MGLDTLSFSFLFLPALFLLFSALPEKYRNVLLAAASLLFYALADYKHLPLMFCSVLFDYLVCAKMVRSSGEMKGRKILFWTSVVKNIGLILIMMTLMELYKISLPLGLLVYTTTSMGYVIDVYNGDEQFDGSFVNYLVFSSFFAKLYAGPIVRYSDLKNQWENRDLSAKRIWQACRLYLGGLGKIVLLARGNIEIQTAIQQIPQQDTSVLSVWLLIITSTFALYYTLTGYGDMARGLGNFFGMDFPENFHHPFQSRTVSDFFNRFNITVTQFINRYVYVFLGADTNGVLPTAVNTLLTTMLMGLWFGIRLNYLVWGIYFTGFILLEKYFLMKYLKKIPPIFDRIYTFIVVMFSFTIFSGRSLSVTGDYIAGMFGMSGLPLYNNYISYILSSNYLTVILSFFFATGLTGMMEQFIRSKLPWLFHVLDAAMYAGIFIASVAFLV